MFPTKRILTGEALKSIIHLALALQAKALQYTIAYVSISESSDSYCPLMPQRTCSPFTLPWSLIFALFFPSVEP